MKKEFLLELGVSEDAAQKIMDENGRDIQNVDRKLAAMTGERDTLQTQLGGVQEKLAAFDGLDPEKTKGEITRLSNELAAAQKTHAAELAKLQRRSETKDFMSGLKFVNDETREYYLGKLETALDEEGNRGRSRREILDGLVNGEDGKPRANIFASEDQPPPYASGTGTNPMLGKYSNEPRSVLDNLRQFNITK